jgi:hypothetical protein
MKIKPFQPADLCDDPFDQSDLFGQRGMATQLQSLFANLEHGSVALLEGRWGVGKTTFVRRLKRLVEVNGQPVIYFDAFESDYMESPFEALSGVFVKAAYDQGKEDDPKYRLFLRSAAKAGKHIAGTAAKIGVRAATVGIIGSEEIKKLGGMKEAIADALSEKSEEVVEALIESHVQKSAEFAQLGKSIRDLPSLLGKDKNSNQKMLVIIDELDRCRPDFALGILETIKHFFNAENIHFLLVTNREHLMLSVNHKYGVANLANEYLDKFFDFSIFFDVQSVDEHGQGLKRFVQDSASQIINTSKNGASDLVDLAYDLARSFNLSLRQIERLTTTLALSYIAETERQFRPNAYVGVLCLMKILDVSLYKKAKLGNLTYDDYTNFMANRSPVPNRRTEWIDHMFEYALKPESRNERHLERYNGLASSFLLDDARIIPFICNSILDRFGV